MPPQRDIPEGSTTVPDLRHDIDAVLIDLLDNFECRERVCCSEKKVHVREVAAGTFPAQSISVSIGRGRTLTPAFYQIQTQPRRGQAQVWSQGNGLD